VPAVEVEIDVVVAPVLHTYVLPPVAVSVAVPPVHIAALLTDGVGRALTETARIAVSLHPEAVTVTVYVLAELTDMAAVVTPVLHR
jgi:hypothetical protein